MEMKWGSEEASSLLERRARNKREGPQPIRQVTLTVPLGQDPGIIAFQPY